MNKGSNRRVCHDGRCARFAGDERHLTHDVAGRERPEAMVLTARGMKRGVRRPFEEDQQAVRLIALPDQRVSVGKQSLLCHRKQLPQSGRRELARCGTSLEPIPEVGIHFRAMASNSRGATVAIRFPV